MREVLLRMIRHIVFFSAKDPSDVEAIRAGLQSFGAKSLIHPKFEVSLNRKSDPLSSAVDVVVYAEFDDDAALAAYRAHPIYRDTTQSCEAAARAAVFGGFCVELTGTELLLAIISFRHTLWQ